MWFETIIIVSMFKKKKIFAKKNMKKKWGKTKC